MGLRGSSILLLWGILAVARAALANDVEVQFSPVNKTVVGTYSPYQIVIDGVTVASTQLKLQTLSINQHLVRPGEDRNRFFYQTMEDVIRISGSLANGTSLQASEIHLPRILSAKFARKQDGVSNEIVFHVEHATAMSVDGIKLNLASKEVRWTIPTTESTEGTLHSVELLGTGSHRRLYNLTWQDPTANVSDRCSATKLRWEGFQKAFFEKQAQVQSRWKWIKPREDSEFETPICRTWVKLPKGFLPAALGKNENLRLKSDDPPFLVASDESVVSLDSNQLSETFSWGVKSIRGENGIVQITLEKANGKPSLLSHPGCDSAHLTVKAKTEGGEHLFTALYCRRSEGELNAYLLSSPESSIVQHRFDGRVNKRRSVTAQRVGWRVNMMDPKMKNAFTLAAFKVGKTGSRVFSDYWVVKSREEATDVNAPKIHTLSPSLGVTFIQYTETSKQDYKATAMTVKLGYTYFAFLPHWNLGLATYFTAFTLSQNIPGVTVRFLGFNLRAGYTVPSIRPPFRVSLAFGYYFTTMDVVGAKFGFKGIGGPQLYPSVRYFMGLDQSLVSYAKFSPVNDQFRLLDFSSYELALGLGWLHRVGDGQEFGVYVDTSTLKLKIDMREGTSRSVSLSLGYTL